MPAAPCYIDLTMAKRRSDDADEPAIPGMGAFHHGRDEAMAWLGLLGLEGSGRWHVEIELETRTASQFHLNVYAEEWGFAFHHARRSSWIRVTDIPFVHGRDDFGFIRQAPPLATLASFLSVLETEHEVRFPRSTAAVRSNVTGAAAAVRRWLSPARTR